MKRQPDCTIKEESLLLFHYRELAPKERLALTEHLRQCPACRQRLAELQNSLASLPRPTLELSAAEVGWLSARIAARTRPSPRPRFWLWSGAVATAALVVSLAAWPPTGPDSRLGVQQSFGQPLRLFLLLLPDFLRLALDLQGKAWKRIGLSAIRVITLDESCDPRMALKRWLYTRDGYTISPAQYQFQATQTDSDKRFRHAFGYQRTGGMGGNTSRSSPTLSACASTGSPGHTRGNSRPMT